jgi:hypothetical protein
MNETQLIRQQLATEREHASAVANACASALGRAEAGALGGSSPLGEFRQACVEYLVCVLAWFEERDQRLAELWPARRPATDSAWRAVEEVLSRRGGSREALEKLEAALAATASASAPRTAPKSWQDFAKFFDSVWSARRDAIDELLARAASTADWRLVGGIDADSILEERRRYARVAQALPAGESLTVAQPAREI